MPKRREPPKPERPRPRQPTPEEREEPTAIPLDFEEALRGVLAVDPDTDSAELKRDDDL